ncbi:hypothetical protein HZC09_04090 [Candidatus Micrarchaeota archaeon]|nr:hypothetical protein [Candidatus Micrarchaeota archaeon]
MEEFHKALRAFYGNRVPNIAITGVTRTRHELLFPGEPDESRKFGARKEFKKALVSFLKRENLWDPKNGVILKMPEGLERKSTGMTPEEREKDERDLEKERAPISVKGTPAQIHRIYGAIVEYLGKMQE